MLRSSNYVFQCVPIFDKKTHEFEFPWQPNRSNNSNFTAKNVQMEQNGMFYVEFYVSLLDSTQKVGLR